CWACFGPHRDDRERVQHWSPRGPRSSPAIYGPTYAPFCVLFVIRFELVSWNHLYLIAIVHHRAARYDHSITRLQSFSHGHGIAERIAQLHVAKPRELLSAFLSHHHDCITVRFTP